MLTITEQIMFTIKNSSKMLIDVNTLVKKTPLNIKHFPGGSRPGVLYGNPKVHKSVTNNCPKLCPILSTIGTPTYKLAKYLVPVLSPLTSNKFAVHDSFSFADEVSSFCPDHFMASLDVECLFTNIPLNEVIDICIDDLFCDINKIHNLDRYDMRELFKR